MTLPSKKVRQKQEIDAKELAVLLYDIFKDHKTNNSALSANNKELPKKEG